MASRAQKRVKSGTTAKEGVKVKEVRALVQTSDGGADYHDQGRGHWIIDSLIANPMSRFEEYKQSRLSWGINALGTFIVEVELENGIVGIGTSIGGEPACYIVENHLSRFVEGQDCRNIELMWEKMYRATLPYGRKGVTIHAISAVDLALWDCLGKLYNEPVYNLLGGKTKEKLPVYATTARPDLAKKMGFIGAKVPLPHGPADGDEGLRKNVDFLTKHRESVGPDFPLMIDCYMALTPAYSVKLLKKIEHLNYKWLEEFLPPDDYEGYDEVRNYVRMAGNPIMLTTGEHEYTRYGMRQLLQRRCVDIIQPDVNWVGGLTECRRIVAMAAAHDVMVIPHGSSVFSYHMQYAFNQCPIAEYLVMSPEADKIVPLFKDLFDHEPLPKDGWINLPDKPGWGVNLNPNLKLRRPYPPEKRAAYVPPSEVRMPPHMPF